MKLGTVSELAPEPAWRQFDRKHDQTDFFSFRHAFVTNAQNHFLATKCLNVFNKQDFVSFLNPVPVSVCTVCSYTQNFRLQTECCGQKSVQKMSDTPYHMGADFDAERNKDLVAAKGKPRYAH